MSDLGKKFLTAFAELEMAIGKRFSDAGHIPFMQRVRDLAKSNSIIRRYMGEIQMFADLRNVMVHKRFEGELLAEPAARVVETLQMIAGKLLSPPKVVDHFKVDIREFSTQDTMNTVYTYLGDKDFSQVFVRNESGRLVCLSACTMQRWSAQQASTGLIDLDTTIVEVLSYSEAVEELSFLQRCASVSDAQNLFGSLTSPFQIAVVVTENGKPTEKPLALVTAWDLGRIERLVNGEEI